MWIGIWNPSNCECECDKSCDVAEYLDNENCKCSNKLVDKLIEKCTENIDEAKIAEITSMELHSTENENNHKCSSCVMYTVLFSIIFTMNIGIGSYFLYFHSYLKKGITRVKCGTYTQTAI